MERHITLIEMWGRGPQNGNSTVSKRQTKREAITGRPRCQGEDGEVIEVEDLLAAMVLCRD